MSVTQTKKYWLLISVLTLMAVAMLLTGCSSHSTPPEAEMEKEAELMEEAVLPDLQSFSGNQLTLSSEETEDGCTKLNYAVPDGLAVVEEYVELLASYDLAVRDRYEKDKSSGLRSVIYSIDYTGSQTVNGFDLEFDILDAMDIEIYLAVSQKEKDLTQITLWYSSDLKQMDTGERTAGILPEEQTGTPETMPEESQTSPPEQPSAVQRPDGPLLPDPMCFADGKMTHTQTAPLEGDAKTQEVYYFEYDEGFLQEYLTLLGSYGMVQRDRHDWTPEDGWFSYAWVFDYTGPYTVTGFHAGDSDLDDENVALYLWLLSIDGDAELHVRYSEDLIYMDTGERTTHPLADSRRGNGEQGSASGGGSSGGSSDDDGPYIPEHSKLDCLTCDGDGDCTTCNGYGEIERYSSDGTVTSLCPDCRGSRNCRDCGGSGKR